MTVEEAIIALTYGFDDYIKAIKETPQFDINEILKHKKNYLLLAISAKKWDVASDLIERGINVNHQDEHGDTALLWLCRRPLSDSKINLIKKMIEAGANPNIRSKDYSTPLYIAVSNCIYNCSEEHFGLLEYLLENGGDITVPVSKKGSSIEEIAEENANQKTVELLKKYKNNNRAKMYPDDVDEIYNLADKAFDKKKFIEVVDALTVIPEEQKTRKHISLLVAAYNNLGGFDQAVINLRKYKSLFVDTMRVWYYFSAFAFIGKKEYENALADIEAGLSECEKDKLSGNMDEKLYQSEIKDFEQLRKRCKL